jgi:hypothetical protein
MLSFDATKDMNCLRIPNAIAHNVWLPDVVADLATEFSPLAQNGNSKNKPTTYRKIAIAFDSGYKPFLLSWFPVRIIFFNFPNVTKINSY